MSDQPNNFDCNFSGQQNPYHQPQQNMMFHPNNMPQGMNQFMNHNNMVPHAFSPAPHGFNPQIQLVGHIGQSQTQNQGIIGQQQQFLYMQQTQQNHNQHKQQQVNGMKSFASRNSIDNIQVGRNHIQQQQNDNSKQKFNKNTNGSRLNMAIASFPHIPQTQHQQIGNQGMQNQANQGVTSSPPPHHNQSQKTHQQKGHQALGQPQLQVNIQTKGYNN